MYHSANINGINTYDDWHIIPTSPLRVSMPPVREQYIELIGANGDFDLSESLTGYPLYQNRTGSWEFLVLNSYNGVSNFDPSKLYSEIAYMVHGRKSKIVFEDDPEYYYSGRLSLGDWSSDPNNSTITINYNLDPYKYELQDAATKYEDVFKFYSISGNNIEIPINFADYVDRMPVHPEIIIRSDGSSTFSTKFTNEELNIVDRVNNELISGINEVPRYTITNFSGSNNCTLKVSGNGEIKVNFRNGRL